MSTQPVSSETDQDAVLLVIGIGSQKDRDSRPYREYLLSAAAQRFKLWLFDSNEPTWQSEYVVGANALNCYDPEAVTEAARRLAEQRPVIGMFCPDEGTLLAASHAAAALGVPGMSVDTVTACRDKKTTRALLTRAGIAQPRFTTVRSPGEALRAADDLEYPVVLKPRNLGSSLGVIKVSGPDEMAGAFGITTAAAYPGVEVPDDYIVEQYLDGPEVSIDGAVFDGAYTPMFVGRKQVGGEPYFVETGHTVTAGDPLLEDEALIAMLQDAHTALGITHGTTHTEVKLTSRGPVIVEVNGRLGGDLIPYLGKLATGIDPGLVAVDVITDRRPDFTGGLSRTVGIRFFGPEEDCRVERITLAEPAPGDGVLQLAKVVSPGVELYGPPKDYVARYAFAVAEGADQEECNKRLDAAGALVSLESTPISSAPIGGTP
ncbi:ATP-grasp domain-containing protein [Streptomyces sp. NRRL WC-3742]|uniref:ATP-grasp domain-containing protein n=1 Tax=Streptomyces sp. NRRL WC-3742 TaxID=1463934 RepID=UPI0004C73C07|nr:ATP-grasp domain-containing protein [Streptomyces sp. NRRL WC-3742]